MKEFVLLLEELILGANSFCQELTPCEKGDKMTVEELLPPKHLPNEKQIAVLNLLIIE